MSKHLLIGLTILVLLPVARAQEPDKQGAGEAELRRWIMGLGPVPLPHGRPISALAFTPDGKTIVSVSNDLGKVYHWDAASGKLLREWGMPQGKFYTSALSTGGQVLAVHDQGGLVSLWDAATGKRLHILKDARSTFLSLSSDGKSLVGGLADGSLGVWDVAQGKLRARLPKSAWTSGLALAFSPDGKHIAASRPDTTVGIWDAATGKEVGSLKVDTADVNLIAFMPGSNRLVTVTGPGEVKLWNTASANVRRRMNVPLEHRVTGGFFTADGRSLLTTGADGTVRMLEIASGKERHCFPGLIDRITCAALAADGKSIVMGCGDMQALVRPVSGHNLGDSLLQKPTPPKNAAAAWSDLAQADSGRAYRAVAVLAEQADAVEFLQKNLHPAAPVDQIKIAQLLKDLDNPKFAVRQKASKELENLHDTVEEQLEALLRDPPTLEVARRAQNLMDRMRFAVPPQRLQAARALEVLESIGTPAARAVLRSMAQGAPLDPVTQDARAALKRLEKTKTATGEEK